MKTKLAILAKCTVAAAFLLLLAAPAMGQTATVTTDKEGYSPGETVIITGTGWQPGETVLMVIHEDPFTCPDRQLSSVADSSGNFTNSTFTLHQHNAGHSFTLTATGQSSGRTAETTFIDAPVPLFDVAPAHVPAGGANTFSALVRNVATGSGDTVRCIRVITNTGSTVNQPTATFTVASPGKIGRAHV